MIVAMPRMATAGQTCGEIVELVDFLPTLCDFWQLPKSSKYEGTSFVPLLEDARRPWKQAAFSMITLGGLGRSVRTKRYKYAEYRRTRALPSAGEQPHAVELYDLAEDPLEQHDVATDPAYTETVKELAVLLRQSWPAALPPD
jgi:arylsulfatase A-like enzyme